MVFRTLNLANDASQDETSKPLSAELFEYLVREYYVIAWAYLFKLDYAFKVRGFDEQSNTVALPHSAGGSHQPTDRQRSRCNRR